MNGFLLQAIGCWWYLDLLICKIRKSEKRKNTLYWVFLGHIPAPEREGDRSITMKVQ